MWPVIAGTLLTVYGSVTAGQASKKAANQQAQALREQAAYSRAFAGFQGRRQREADARAIGRQVVQIAKSGVELVGSPLDAYGASVRNAELNARAILLEGELRARGIEAQARLVAMEGRAASQASVIGAGASAVSSIIGATASGGGGSRSTYRFPSQSPEDL